jgi:hypothetical protein
MAESEEGFKQFDVPTTAQVERTYRVVADSPEQAHKRLRAWLADADMIADGVVTLNDTKNTSDETVKKGQIKEVTKPKVVGGTAADRKAS